MKANAKLLSDQKELLDDVGRYCQLMGKLNYITVTKSDRAFVVCCKPVSLSIKNNMQ